MNNLAGRQFAHRAGGGGQLAREGQLIGAAGRRARQRHDARASGFVRAQVRENFLRRGRLFREHQLQIMAQRIFHRRDELIRHPDVVRERTDDGT